MAIIKTGPIIAAIRGLLGGVIFSQNKGGPYAKIFAVPTNPMTTRQTDVRGDFASLVSDWNNRLTNIERLEWNDFAQLNPQLNRLGETIFLSGLNWFVKLNTKLLQAALTVADNPPPLASNPAPDSSFDIDDLDPAGITIDIAFDITQPWVGTDGAAMLVYASKPQSLGTNNFNVPYRFAGAILGDLALPPTSPATLNFPYIGSIIGMKATAKATIVLPSGAAMENMQAPYATV